MRENQKISRRAFLVAAGGTIISIGLPGVFVKLSDAEQRSLATETRPDGRPRLPPGQLAVQQIRDMGGAPGMATTSDWRLQIHGEVDKPIILSYQNLLHLDQVKVTCDIHCVTGWTLLDSEWQGVRLSTILDAVRPRKKAKFVIFEAAHGYTSNVPISEAGKKDVILAHSFTGEKLPKEYGAPVRALVPDRYLYKSAKWIEGIKVTSVDEPGYWESQGYSNSADPWKEERYQDGE